MEPYQQRVIEEKIALDEKRIKLLQFIVSPAFDDLPCEEGCRLQRQETYTGLYSRVLTERIGEFTQ